jgi:hypothetical protein
MSVRTKQPYRPDNQNHRPDIQDNCQDIPTHRLDASHTKIEKEKRAEKYFPNNFQSMHVYNTDILVQLAFIKYPRYN